MKQFYNLLMYGGLDLQSFRRIEQELHENNRVNLSTFTIITAVAMAIMSISSFLVQSLTMNRYAYIGSAVLCLCLWGTTFAAKRRSWLIYVGIYLFMALLFAFGIILGTVTTPEELTVSFFILLFAVPLLFTDSPLRMGAAIFLGSLAYCVCAWRLQEPARFRMNLVNVYMYGTLSIVVSTFMMRIKIQGMHLEVENRYLSGWDALTGLMNRRSFEDALKRLRTGEDSASWFCALDVNGLKRVNDQIGHAAGDELLQGAAKCIRKTFASFGTCFRIGGDEFLVILRKDAPAPETLIAAFEQETAAWHGDLVKSLSVSLGIVPVKHGDDLEEIVSQADKAMYAQKQAYYAQQNSNV